MTKPETLFEAASYDLNQFRERRMADRRAQQRDTPDRRRAGNGVEQKREPQQTAADGANKEDA